MNDHAKRVQGLSGAAMHSSAHAQGKVRCSAMHSVHLLVLSQLTPSMPPAGSSQAGRRLLRLPSRLSAVEPIKLSLRDSWLASC